VDQFNAETGGAQTGHKRLKEHIRRHPRQTDGTITGGTHDARLHHRRSQGGDALDHAPRAIRLRQRVPIAQPILQRDDEGVGVEQGAQAAHGRACLVAFHQHQGHVYRFQQQRFIGGDEGEGLGTAVRLHQRQPMRLNRVQLLRPGTQHHHVGLLRQPRGHQRGQSPCAYHAYAQRHSLKTRVIVHHRGTESKSVKPPCSPCLRGAIPV